MTRKIDGRYYGGNRVVLIENKPFGLVVITSTKNLLKNLQVNSIWGLSESLSEDKWYNLSNCVTYHRTQA